MKTWQLWLITIVSVMLLLGTEIGRKVLVGLFEGLAFVGSRG